MSEIVPTILTNDKNLYRKQYEDYSKFTKRIQVDICDGTFAPSQTIDVSNCWWQEGWAAMDLHMMVMNPSAHLPAILKIKPSLVIFHAESGENLLSVFATLKQARIKCGVALMKQTYPGRVAPYLQAADHCLIFAGTLGQQGGEADMMQIEKVPLIKAIAPNIEIGWDGGVDMTNVRALAHSDINILNVGSAIIKAEDPKKAFEDLSEEATQRGVLI